MNPEKFQEIQYEVAQKLKKLDTTYIPLAEPVYGPYHQAAAVLSTYHLETLRPVGTPETNNLDKVAADSSLVTYKGQTCWALLPEIRKRVLKQMGSRETLKQALAANPPRAEDPRAEDPVQQMLEAYIHEKAPLVKDQNAAQLIGTSKVIEWLAGVLDEDDLPDPQTVRRQQEWVSFRQPFKTLCSDFRGREEELRRLHDYVVGLPSDSPQIDNYAKQPVMIFGPGGVGKSTLVARFFLEYIDLPQEQRFPFTYIDFDRPGLLAEEPLTILIEAVRQLSIQYPDHREAWDRIRANNQKRLKNNVNITRRGNVQYTGEIDHKGGAIVNLENVLRDFGSLLKRLNVAEQPFLLVLDTFEEVQYCGDIVISGFCAFLKALQTYIPQTRIVLSGRSESLANENFPIELMELKDLDQESAISFLEAQGISPKETAHAIFNQIGGNPLSLKLAIDVWRLDDVNQDGIPDLKNPELLGLSMKENVIQGQLFARILNHIHDEDVRKLAYPGMVLRWITPDLIRQVLAEPCGITLKREADAKDLFEKMGREVSLVSYEDGALRHRSDVRRLMIHLLREEQPQLVRQIEEAAVAYYEKQDEPIARAEEIYHRLSLQQAFNIIEPRWKDGLKVFGLSGLKIYLKSTLEELNIRERVWLASRLGYRLSKEERQQADLESWELEAAQQAQELLQRNAAEQVITLLQERPEWLPGSPLYALAARARELLKNFDGARSVIEKGLTSAGPIGNSDLAIELRMIGVRIDLQLKEFQTAQQKLAEVESVLTTRPKDLIRRLEVELYRFAIMRVEGVDVKRKDKVKKLVSLFKQLPDALIAQESALMGWLAGEVGSDYPDEKSYPDEKLDPDKKSYEDLYDYRKVYKDLYTVLRRILQWHNLITNQQSLLRQLGRALAEWDSRVSLERKAKPGLLAQKAELSKMEKLTGAKTFTEQWNQFVLEADPQTRTQKVTLLLDTFSPVIKTVWEGIVAILSESAPQAAMFKTVDEKQVFTRTMIPPQSEQLQLTEKQIEQFAEAILDSFPTLSDLSKMIISRFDRNLESLSLANDIRTVAPELVRVAYNEGWAGSLLIAARKSNPGNLKLFMFAQKFGLAPKLTLNAKELERMLHKSPHPLDVSQLYSSLGSIEPRICQIEIAGALSGTGFLVGPNMLMTSFHVIAPIFQKAVKVEDVILHFDEKCLTDGTILDEGMMFHLAPNWLIDYSPYAEFEYALVRLAETPGLETIGREHAEASAALRGWIEVPLHRIKLTPGMPLMSLQYTKQKTVKLVIHPESLVGVDNVSHHIVYRNKMTKSSYGTPIFTINWEFVGMHIGTDSFSKLNRGISSGYP